MATTGIVTKAKQNDVTNAGSIFRKLLLVSFLILGIIGLVFSLSYLVINIFEIPIKIESQNYIESSATATDYFAFLRLISIDLSAITPFLLSWYFFNIVRNTGMVLVGQISREELIVNADVLPMHLRYEVQWIQLGLLGTLWGFMIIGWGMKDIGIGGGNIDTLNILLKAFGTALLSTFAGTVLAYVFGPIAIYLWQWANNIPQERDELDAHLERLGQRLRETNSKLRETDAALGDLQAGIIDLKEEIARILPSEVMPLLRTFADNTTNIRETIEALRIVLEKRSTAESLKPELIAIKDTVVQLKNDDTVNQLKNDLTARTQAIEKAIMGLGESISTPMAMLAKVLAEKIDQTEAVVKKGADTHKQAIIDKLNALEKTIRKSEHRTHVTIEVKDLEKITDLNQKIHIEIKSLMDEYRKLQKKRSFWSWWPFNR